MIIVMDDGGERSEARKGEERARVERREERREEREEGEEGEAGEERRDRRIPRGLPARQEWWGTNNCVRRTRCRQNSRIRQSLQDSACKSLQTCHSCLPWLEQALGQVFSCFP